jgi:hypothetical protein
VCGTPWVLVSAARSVDEIWRIRTNNVPAPLHAHHEQKHAADRQKSSEVVDLTKHLSSSKALAVDTRWWEVKTRRHDKADESPQSAEQTDPTPRRVVCDQLSPQHRRAEGNDRKDQNGNIFTTLAGGSQLGGRGQGSKFVNSGTDSSKYHTADEGIHGVGGGADDHANNNASGSDQCDPSTTDQIGDGACEWADGCETEQVGQNKPDPTVSTA